MISGKQKIWDKNIFYLSAHKQKEPLNLNWKCLDILYVCILQITYPFQYRIYIISKIKKFMFFSNRWSFFFSRTGLLKIWIGYHVTIMDRYNQLRWIYLNQETNNDWTLFLILKYMGISKRKVLKSLTYICLITDGIKTFFIPLTIFKSVIQN